MRKKSQRSDKPQMVKVGNIEIVIMPRETWELILEKLEDLEDIRAYQEAEAMPDEETIEHDELSRQLGRCPLRYLRNLANMTQDELAKKSGLSQSYIAKVESGEREITLSSAKKLAKAMGLKPEKLIPNR